MKDGEFISGGGGGDKIIVTRKFFLTGRWAYITRRAASLSLGWGGG